MKSFHIDVTREDGRWVAVVKGLRGGATETRTLTNLETEVRDLISGLTDVEPDSFSLEWHWAEAIGSGPAEAMAEFVEVRNRLELVKAKYDRVQHEAVALLRGKGVSIRDAAWLLDLSFQRVQQIDKEPKVPTARGISEVVPELNSIPETPSDLLVAERERDHRR